MALHRKHSRERQSLSSNVPPFGPYDSLADSSHHDNTDFEEENDYEKMARPRSRYPDSNLPLRQLVPRYFKTVFSRRSGFVNAIIVGVVFSGVVIVLAVNSYNAATARAVEAARKAAEEANKVVYPDYNSYPLIDSYYNGLFNLINRSSNTPQWPSSPLSTKPTPENFNPLPKSHPYDASHLTPDAVPCSFSDSSVTRASPLLRRFSGLPAGFPQSVFGSPSLLGWDAEDVCYDRYGRYGAYGYGYPESEGGLGVGLPPLRRRTERSEGGHFAEGMPQQKIDWRGINWADLQSRCVALNAHRFYQPKDEDGTPIKPAKKITGVSEHIDVQPSASDLAGKAKRTAILVRMWAGYKFTPNDILNLRSLISETALASGGEYQVHILLHVKNDDIPIFADPAAYARTVEENVPEEFRGLVTLWNVGLSKSIYSNLKQDGSHLPIHGVYRSSFMPVQLFALAHPEYQYFFNWEADVRLTGHVLPMLRSLETFATKQPRLHLWERSSSFYIPTLHGSYEGYSKMIRRLNPDPILGALPPPDSTPIGPKPPTNLTELETWGINEEADLITLMPFFDPSKTHWNLRNTMAGYPKNFPLRTSILAHSRLSRRLLRQMHLTNAAESRTAFTESLPVSTCLHHGLKAVHVPHPVYFDRMWKDGKEVGAFFNVERMDVYGDRQGEWGFRGGTWYANARFGGDLYKAWWDRDGKEGEREGKKGRMCLGQMFMHPVKW
ncbi:hypothetical protein BJ508DRAFT_329682 [Ascobolus immersus RN42]|uniref:Uncharacterized protein n=1 Tax=Ascobolus immersus RN42 TaxID=1160509 RepID=A0A3N4HVZ3_ASCIM|nr:hypothetical protein BJ508DRAFT_329682 [Ascobolus immersus RN42]